MVFRKYQKDFALNLVKFKQKSSIFYQRHVNLRDIGMLSLLATYLL